MYKVMIVDDEYPARNMLDLLINWEENGFEMAAKAENGKQALEIYEKLRPELLITDIQMPVMDGISLIREIRKENPKQCVLVLSCHESFDYAQQAIRLGVRDYLIKDMLTTEQLQKCLLRTKEYLDLQNSSGVLPPPKFPAGKGTRPGHSADLSSLFLQGGTAHGQAEQLSSERGLRQSC
ncbi:MAG: response regulator [Lachnospiraceae bacterium]|nr:response regulator [Lachnospiraceae bacterium]MCI9134193.1 response regulator [Lachnospiraceae bacterium]